MVDINPSPTTQTQTQFSDRLTQHMTEGLLLLDDQGFVLSANPAMATILGGDVLDMVGRHYRDFWAKSLLPPEEMANGVVPNQQQRYETVLRGADGQAVPVSITISTMTGLSGNGRLLHIKLLPEVQRLNHALSHAQRLAGVGILTASVAHELNTPLSIITATCSNLLHEIDGNNLDAEQLAHYIKMVEQNAWRSARIVGVLRNYTFDNAPHMAVTDWNMIIEDALMLVRQQFKSDANVQVVVDLQPDLKSIVCDHNRMTQVLINLLTNARDAMLPDGGEIRISSWMDQSKDGDAEAFAFSVSDSGCGIDPGGLDTIFDPFFTTKPEGKGTGLGLFIARQIVEQHNGRITVQNNSDEGATFTVILPRR
ncbi:MAG: nitrogen regulation protein NR(II) [Anaerolineae bacterium]